MRGETLYLFLNEGEACTVIKSECEAPDTRIAMLKEFVDAIEEERMAETSIHDNIKTYEWMDAAIRSAVSGQEVMLCDIQN